MTTVTRRVAARAVGATVAAVVLLLAIAAPATAHSELISSTPANGAHLDSRPAEVTLRFTERINLIDGGLRLLDARGGTVSTPEPVAHDATIRWPMPVDLPDGAYLVNWRVISADGHPVSGAFAFGVAVDAQAVASVSGEPATAPWPVVLNRYAGYLAFALVIGVVAFLACCSSGGSGDPVLRRLVRLGLLGLVATAALGYLLQGPYTTGAPWRRILDVALLRETASTPFGTAMLWRLVLTGAMTLLLWNLDRLHRILVRAPVVAALVGSAVTFAAAGHGAASGRLLDLGATTLHILAAGTWVGGLAVVALLGRGVERRALLRFSRLALASVLLLVATGVVNSVLHVDAVSQLFLTRYGLMLSVKVLVVGAALAAAAVSRARLKAHRSLGRSVRAEAVLTVGVLAVTASLSLTNPPPTLADPGSPASYAGSGTDDRQGQVASVTMQLAGGRTALVQVSPPATGGSEVTVAVLDAEQQAVPARRVQLRISSPERGIDDIRVPLSRGVQVWQGDLAFPLPGSWKLTLTVQDQSPTATVTAGELEVTR